MSSHPQSTALSSVSAADLKYSLRNGFATVRLRRANLIKRGRPFEIERWISEPSKSASAEGALLSLHFEARPLACDLETSPGWQAWWSSSASPRWSKERSPLPWTGAPCSPQRTWAEDDGAQPLRTLLLYSGQTAARSKSRCTWSESIGRIRFRPMYAQANMGHPSRTNDRSL